MVAVLVVSMIVIMLLYPLGGDATTHVIGIVLLLVSLVLILRALGYSKSDPSPT